MGSSEWLTTLLQAPFFFSLTQMAPYVWKPRTSDYDATLPQALFFVSDEWPPIRRPPPAPLDELSDSNLTPLPTHRGTKYVTRSPLLRSHGLGSVVLESTFEVVSKTRTSDATQGGAYQELCKTSMNLTTVMIVIICSCTAC